MQKYSSVIRDKNPFLSLFTPRNICCGYLLESPRRGDCNKYPRFMFLGIFNTILSDFFNNPFDLELRTRCNQSVVKTNFVVLSNVGIKSIYRKVLCKFLYTPDNPVSNSDYM